MKTQLVYVNHFKELEVSEDYTLHEDRPPYLVNEAPNADPAH